jgi:hypothetical protein
MAGLEAAIHGSTRSVLYAAGITRRLWSESIGLYRALTRAFVDGRVEPGHDDER